MIYTKAQRIKVTMKKTTQTPDNKFIKIYKNITCYNYWKLQNTLRKS